MYKYREECILILQNSLLYINTNDIKNAINSCLIRISIFLTDLYYLVAWCPSRDRVASLSVRRWDSHADVPSWALLLDFGALLFESDSIGVRLLAPPWSVCQVSVCWSAWRSGLHCPCSWLFPPSIESVVDKHVFCRTTFELLGYNRYLAAKSFCTSSLRESLSLSFACRA